MGFLGLFFFFFLIFLKALKLPFILCRDPFPLKVSPSDVIMKTLMYKHKKRVQNAIPFIGLSSFFLRR